MSINVQGIEFWGEDKGEITEDELNQVSSPLDSVLHLLRHFSLAPDDWRQGMVERESTTQEFIEKQLVMPGSKWNPEVGLSTPEDVISFAQSLFRRALQGEQELRWIRRGEIDFCYLSREITPSEKSELLGHKDNFPIGKMGIILIEDVPSNVNIVQRSTRGGIVNVVNMELVDTDKVVTTLARKSTGIIQIYTAFPGILTPPVPREKQSPGELKYNRSFWDQYALIETGSMEGGK